MFNKIIRNVIGMSSLALSTFAMAKDQTKDKWLTSLRDAAAPELICTGLLKDQARSVTLARLNISYEKCLTLIPDLFSKCEKELDKSLPSSFNKQSGEMWEQVIGECIGSAFVKKYLVSASPQS
jgi:hypothetical protein